MIQMSCDVGLAVIEVIHEIDLNKISAMLTFFFVLYLFGSEGYKRYDY